jgi:ADP-ribosyl-[dinitrogen reductase] hydrolase
MAERIEGCLIAGAVGDALGYRVEFSSWREIMKEHGPAGVKTPIGESGQAIVSDDTQMTMFTADGLLRAYQRQMTKGITTVTGLVHDSYLAWLRTQTDHPTYQLLGNINARGSSWLLDVPELHELRAPGNTCLQALSSGNIGTIREPINNSKGCGTVMRMAPIGLLTSINAFDVGCDISAITHGHPTGYLSGGALALIIQRLMLGDTLDLAIQSALDRLTDSAIPKGHAAETIDAIQRAFDTTAAPTPEVIKSLGEGWVAEEALAIALMCVRNVASPLEAIVAAANHDGDSDSTAAIAGNIVGVIHGIGFLPSEWMDKVDVRESLGTIATDVHEVFYAEAKNNPRYPID